MCKKWSENSVRGPKRNNGPLHIPCSLMLRALKSLNAAVDKCSLLRSRNIISLVRKQENSLNVKKKKNSVKKYPAFGIWLYSYIYSSLFWRGIWFNILKSSNSQFHKWLIFWYNWVLIHLSISEKYTVKSKPCEYGSASSTPRCSWRG